MVIFTAALLVKLTRYEYLCTLQLSRKLMTNERVLHIFCLKIVLFGEFLKDFHNSSSSHFCSNGVIAFHYMHRRNQNYNSL